VNLIITETHRAVTQKQKQILNAKCLAFTFLPKFKNTNALIETHFDYSLTISNMKRSLYLDNISSFELIDFLKKYQYDIIALIKSLITDDDVIFLAQDNDTYGNFMASLLYYKLLEAGVSPSKIKRVVGLQISKRNGFDFLDIYIGTFIDEKLFFSIINKKRLEQNFIFKAKKESMLLYAGYRKNTSLFMLIKTINNYQQVEMPKKSDGISLATYLTNGLIAMSKEEI